MAVKTRAKPSKPAAVPKFACDGCKMLRICGVTDTSKCEWCAARRGEPSPGRERVRQAEERKAMDARLTAVMLQDVNGGVRVWDKKYGDTLRRWKAEVEKARAAGTQPPPWRWENTFANDDLAAPPPAKAVPVPADDLIDAWGFKLGTRQARVNQALADSGKWMTIDLLARRAKCPADAAKAHLKILHKAGKIGRREKDGVWQVRIAAAFA